jgi:hypothetical protein
MNTNRDHLDEAIDHVAKRLTHVDEDAQFASRFVAALPERVTWFGWLTHSWAPRLAMLAIVAGALLFANARRTTDVAPSAPPLASVANSNWPQLVASINPEPRTLGTPGTKPLEPVEPMEPLEPFVGLPSVTPPSSVAIESLVIADLPLTAESFPERD